MENADHTRRIVRLLKASRALLPALVFGDRTGPSPGMVTCRRPELRRVSHGLKDRGLPLPRREFSL